MHASTHRHECKSKRHAIAASQAGLLLTVTLMGTAFNAGEHDGRNARVLLKGAVLEGVLVAAQGV